MDEILDLNITDAEYDNPWTHGGERFSLTDEELQKYVGFVYLIQCLSPDLLGKKYIGQKGLWVTKKLPKNSKRKRPVRLKVPSDWKQYYGSSAELQADVERLGCRSFSREILHLCHSKGDMNYLEMREQILQDALISEDFYNSFIGGKIHRRHVTTNVKRVSG